VAEADKRYKQLDALTRAYFKEMNISDALADEMLRIPPESVKFLTRVEADRFGLNGTDPSYADYMNSRMATMYGLSKQEYLQRKNRRDVECGQNYDCDESIMYGITEQEYRLRSKRTSQCGNEPTLEGEWECRRAVYHGTR
jgi:hypothetical protein